MLTSLQLSIVVWSYFCRNGKKDVNTALLQYPSSVISIYLIYFPLPHSIWSLAFNSSSFVCSWLFLKYCFSVNTGDTALKQWQRTQESLNDMESQHATTIASHVRFVNLLRKPCLIVMYLLHIMFSVCIHWHSIIWIWRIIGLDSLHSWHLNAHA